MINFLSYELEEPIIKQYLDNGPRNASYTSHDKYLSEQTNERLKLSADIVLFADEASNTVRKEMPGIFISSFDEKKRNSVWISYL